jgi:hypothetical protein
MRTPLDGGDGGSKQNQPGGAPNRTMLHRFKRPQPSANCLPMQLSFVPKRVGVAFDSPNITRPAGPLDQPNLLKNTINLGKRPELPIAAPAHGPEPMKGIVYTNRQPGIGRIRARQYVLPADPKTVACGQLSILRQCWHTFISSWHCMTLQKAAQEKKKPTDPVVQDQRVDTRQLKARAKRRLLAYIS